MAGSQEAGQDYEHVQMLIERFLQFARDTEIIGSDRVANANDACDQVQIFFLKFFLKKFQNSFILKNSSKVNRARIQLWFSFFLFYLM